MKSINHTPELVYQLNRLSNIAKEVAYAKDETEAEYLTINYLRPLLVETEAFLNNIKSSRNFQL